MLRLKSRAGARLLQSAARAAGAGHGVQLKWSAAGLSLLPCAPFHASCGTIPLHLSSALALLCKAQACCGPRPCKGAARSGRGLKIIVCNTDSLAARLPILFLSSGLSTPASPRSAVFAAPCMLATSAQSHRAFSTNNFDLVLIQADSAMASVKKAQDLIMNGQLPSPPLFTLCPRCGRVLVEC